MLGLIVIGLVLIELSIVINQMIEDMQTIRNDIEEFNNENIAIWDEFFEQYEIDN